MTTISKAARILLAGAAILGGCSSGPAENSGSAKVTAAEVDQRRSIRFDAPTLARLGLMVEPAGSAVGENRLTFPGTLDYALDRYAEVGTIVEGRVASVHANVGDPIRKGQTLATIAVPALVEAQAQVAIAEASVRIADANAKRETALFERELTTAREKEVARGDAEKSRAELDAAKARLALLAGAPGTSIAGGRGNLTLSSPLAGTVVRRDVVLGGRLPPSQTAFVVADLGFLWANVDVFEADLRYVVPGSSAELAVDAFPNRTFRGKVAVVEPVVGVSRTARARIVVDNSEGLLKPGLFFRAELEVDSGSLRSALLVPRGSIQPLGGNNVVFVERKPGEFEVRTVRLGRQTPQLAEITDGLTRGERIVVAGASLIRAEATKQ